MGRTVFLTALGMRFNNASCSDVLMKKARRELLYSFGLYWMSVSEFPLIYINCLPQNCLANLGVLIARKVT